MTGLSKDTAKLADWKLKEIKNGRLAMVAFLGFTAQEFATGKPSTFYMGLLKLLCELFVYSLGTVHSCSIACILMFTPPLRSSQARALLTTLLPTWRTRGT